MLKNFTEKGQWFLPGSTERIFGELTYHSVEGCTLVLHGLLDESHYFHPDLRVPVILGITNRSQLVTLYSSNHISTSDSVWVQDQESGSPTLTFSIRFIFIGAHILSPDDFRFEVMETRLNNLDEWIGISGFERMAFNPASPGEVSINFKLPPPVEFKISEGVLGKFLFRVKIPDISMYHRSKQITQNVYFRIESNEGKDLDAFLELLMGFQNFFIMGLYGRTFPEKITVFGKSFVNGFPGETPKRVPIDVYFSGKGFDDNIRRISALEMFFTYHDIKDEFSDIVEIWFQKYSLLEPAFNLLFEQFYYEGRFTENNFLNLAQAAETFHSRVSDHPRMPVAEYNKMKAAVMEVAPVEYHHWLKDQFNFGNYLNLHARLEEMVNTYSNPTLDEILGSKSDFVKKVKWSRNYYTHYSPDMAKKALKGADLLYITERLKLLLVCSFLIESGISKDKVASFLERRKAKFKFIKAKK